MQLCTKLREGGVKMVSIIYYIYIYIYCKNRFFVLTTLIVWLFLVSEANCKEQPVR